MPCYLYACKVCGFEAEKIHGMLETPVFKCGCGGLLHKVPQAALLSFKPSISKQQDAFSRSAEMHHVLREKHGVERVTPLSGSTLQSAYREIESGGTMVAERMAATREANAAKTKARLKEWSVGARRRAPERSRLALERRNQEQAKKRAITL